MSGRPENRSDSLLTGNPALKRLNLITSFFALSLLCKAKSLSIAKLSVGVHGATLGEKRKRFGVPRPKLSL